MARWFSARIRSVAGLLLASFGVVALPLIVAVGFGVVYVDRLAEQSQRLVLQGVEVTRSSRRLVTIVTDMERSARQFALLNDAQLAQQFANHHHRFQATLDELEALRLDTLANWKLEELGIQGQGLADAVAGAPGAAPLQAVLPRFDAIREQARAITDEGNAFVDQEITRLSATSREARSFLLLCVFALIPAVIVLVFIFTVLISRPIGQIRAAIRQLGEGDLERAVTVSAPTTDLEAVGQQLDWMRTRLAQLESEKNQFLRQMSHELKTPLASIREGVELLRDDALGTLAPKQREVTDILHQDSLELLALIENLLNFAAWQQHRSQLELSEFDLSELLRGVLKRHSLSIERKQLQVESAIAPTPVVADWDQLRMLFDNLISNAIKFSPTRGGLGISIEVERDTLVVDVCDDGPGIENAEREHVFNPFYQSRVQVQSHVKGTGIGLSVAREVARAHGGNIEIIDHPTAKGACMRVRLPLPVNA